MDAMTDELDALRRRYRELAARVSELGFISPGSLTRRHTYCGKPGCRCQADPPQPHGPYWQWTRKSAGKTVTRRLSADEAARYAEWIDNQRQLRALVTEMEQISGQATNLILKQDKTSTTT
jgi:hypothetical protein